ncbi:MAG: alanine--tRNA ligase [Actinobacteria bacterium]|nr:MAG: alanine--tRNA ligase [Actinomycetota bacterium]
MRGDEIRRRFLSFFEEQGHRAVPSSSLIAPIPGLLLTNAGMNQFVPYFLGQEEPPYPRAVTCQKVFRTPDIDHVGHDARHMTFFEMLGNFSFGDYFKREAIRWAHELVTEGYGIDHDLLWVTVYESDDEAAELWVEEAGLSPDRLVRRGKFDPTGEPANFWWTHTAGPCGPCSEIYVDRGPRFGPDGGPDVDEERFLEIWNLVFMQDECDENADVIRELPKKNIDTGSSLERVAMVVQRAGSVFETDLFRPLVQTAERVTGRAYGTDERTDISLRILAEHGRACTFLIGDGVLPSNEGRGYILRRMLRRLVTHARKLGVERPVLADLVETTAEIMGQTYPELRSNKAFILQVAASEEERFAGTYRQGMTLFESEVSKAKGAGSTTLPGAVAFRLHDTYGFPRELTVEAAVEEGLSVDADEFERLMEEQRTRAREAAKKGGGVDAGLAEVAKGAGPSEFLGYERLESEARLKGLLRDGSPAEAASEGQRVRFVLDRTPFYAEGGGQVGDTGMVRGPSGVIEVTDTQPGPGGTIVHEGVVASGEVRQGEEMSASVDAPRREAAARSHTATHVLHHTLRSLVGEHARQAGSLVAPGRLRFDFTHFEPVSTDALEEIEHLANTRLAEDQPTRAYETTPDFARSQGAIALFGEKYGDLVRVVEIGDYSIELCGGTHVHHTGEVGLIRVLSEGSIGSGLRRIEALTGPDGLKQANVERRLLDEVTEALGAGDPAQAPERVRQVMARIKQLESELGKIRRAEQGAEVEQLLQRATDVDGVKLVLDALPGREAGDLRELALRLRNRLVHQPAAVVLVGPGSGKTLLVAALTDDLLSRGLTAGALLEPAAKALGGNAGGKPELAMGGGPRSEAAGDAMKSIPARLQQLLAGV